MQLVGMLDSPFVRRVAISLQHLGVGFTHRSLSVFTTFDEFAAINPVVKAPTLVTDDGDVLVDSSLIIDYAETLSGRSLWPADPRGRCDALATVGLALAVCEKSVQIVYERSRPVSRQHAPWLERVGGQLAAALSRLDERLARRAPGLSAEERIGQDKISAAVAFTFATRVVPDAVDAPGCPALAALTADAERLASFRAAPYGGGTFPVRA